MPNPNLNPAQLEQARKLIEKIRKEIVKLACGDEDLVFAFRRKVAKQLVYDERSRPNDRRKMKDLKWKLQKGVCAICGKELPIKGAELDRFEAKKGYMDPDNVRLVHQECHRADQEKKGYK